MVGGDPEISMKRKRCPEDIYDEVPEQKKLRYYLQTNSPRKQTLGPDVPLTSPESGESRTDEVTSSDTDSIYRDVASPGCANVGAKSPVSSKRQVTMPFQSLLKVNFKYLKDDLEPTSLAEGLFEAELISNEQMEMVTECRSRRRKADLIIKGISREVDKAQKDGIEKIKETVFKALKDSGQGHLIKKMKTTASRIICKYEQNPNVLLHFLAAMEKEVRDSVYPREIIDDLVVVGGITLSDHEDIFCMQHRKDRVEKIINIVQDPSNKENIVKVMGTLIKNYPQLYEAYKLKQQETNTETTPKDLVLLTGGHLNNYPVDPVCAENGVNVKIKLNFGLSDNKQPVMQDTAGVASELREVEKRTVASYNGTVSVQAQMTEELMDSCAALFDKMKVSSVVIHLSAWSEKAMEDILRVCREGRSISWLSKLLSPADMATLERLGVDTVEVEVCVGNRLARVSECHCILTKVRIVGNFSKLLLHMRGCRKAIAKFIELDLVSETQKKQLGRILKVKNVPCRNEDLLRFLVDETYPSVLRCILEQELRSHGCQNLLDTVNASASNSHTAQLTTKHLKDYKEYLTEELDARCFMPAFSDRIQGQSASILVEYVMGSAPRQRRMERFLEYLCENGSDLNWFSEALENQKFGYVLDHVLKRTKDDNKTSRYISWASVMRHCDILMEEVDIVQLKGQLLRDAVIDSSAMTQLETIPSRKGQMAMFLKMLQEQKDQTAATFVWILRDNGYEWIGDQIEKVAKDEYTCPHVASIGKKARYDMLVLKGLFNVKVEERKDSHDEPVSDTVELSKSRDPMIVLDDSADSDIICLSDDSDSVYMAFTSSQSTAEATDAANSADHTTINTDDTNMVEMQKGSLNKTAETNHHDNTTQWVERHFSHDSSTSEKSDIFLLPSSPRSPGAMMKPSRRQSINKGLGMMSAPSPLGACISPSPSVGADSIMSFAGLRFKETDSIATVSQSPDTIDIAEISSPRPTESSTLNSPCPTLNSPCPTGSTTLNSPCPTLNSPCPTGSTTLNSPCPTLNSPCPTDISSAVNSPVPTESRSAPNLSGQTDSTLLFHSLPHSLPPSVTISPLKISFSREKNIALDSLTESNTSSSNVFNPLTKVEKFPSNSILNRPISRPSWKTSKLSQGIAPIPVEKSTISTTNSLDSKSTSSAVKHPHTIDYTSIDRPAGLAPYQTGKGPIRLNPPKVDSIMSFKHQSCRQYPYRKKWAEHRFADSGDTRNKHLSAVKKQKLSRMSSSSMNSSASTVRSCESLEPTETMEMSVSEDEMEVTPSSLFNF